MASSGRPARVFVSYAHDTPQHRMAVLRLCFLLRRLGVDVRVDEWDTDLRHDWTLWMIDQLTHADHVIVIASPEYRAAGDGIVPADHHRGVQTESALLRNFLHRDRATWTPKILPVILPGRTVDEIPLYLQPHCASHYLVPTINPMGVRELMKVFNRQAPRREPTATATHWSASAVSTLPRDVPSFTGRDAEVHQLVRRIVEAREDATAIHVVNGMPGVGKTAFAVHVAQKVAARFPDGHLFLELRGHTPGQQPVTPLDALGSLLLACGVAAPHVPAALDDRARMWRDRLAGKKMLLLLDDVADHEQVRPLLPGAPGCQVVITSRRRLPGLEDARPLPLDVLPPAQSVTMFLRLTGRTADDEERRRIADMMRLCGHLPLAIVLTAGRLRTHPSWDVRYLTSQMVCTRDRLGQMRADDRSVIAAFGLSYRDLPADAQRLFRRLSLYPGVDFDLYAATALGGGDLDTTHGLVETLYLNHLIEEPSPGRYRLHDLIRHYAETLLAGDERRDAVVGPVLDYYVHVATAAARLLPHHTTVEEPPLRGAPPAHAPDLTSESEACEWFARERVNLSGCVDYARGHERNGHAIRLAAALHPYLARYGHWDDALTIHDVAVRAAEREDDLPGLAICLLNLAAVQLMVDDYPSAMITVTRAHRLYVNLGDRRGEAAATRHLGAVQYAMGEYAAATRNLTRALALCTEIGDHLGEATAHYRLGIVQHLTEDHASSSKSLVRAFTMYRRLGCRQGEADAVSYLAFVQGRAGDYSPAMRGLTRALVLFEEIGDKRGEANALCRMGMLLRIVGEYGLGVSIELRAYTLFAELGSHQGQANALCGLAMTRYLNSDRTPRDHAAAVDTFENALALCGRIGDRLCEANIYNTLGVVQHLAGHHQEATASLTRALSLCSGIPDPTGQVTALNNLGRLAWDWPEAGDSFSHHDEALRLARAIGAALEEGRALEGMGRCLIRDSYTGAGTAYLREALEVYERLGVPDARAVRGTLADLAELGQENTRTAAPRPLVHAHR
ncbi:tetratricopeptide repeat protein [Actinophytocola sp.]|uniref:tetratricopeptide repeat protein n=1 Tax=Actinophytocola sp. TaxID=1872138 RepID=UPI002ED20A60